MQTLIHHAKKFLTDNEGATMAEYVVLMAVIVIGVIGAISAFSDAIMGRFEDTTEIIEGADGGGDAG